MGIGVEQIVVGDDPDPWTSAGFSVDGTVCRVGGVTIRLAGTGGSILGWALSDLPAGVDEIEGIATGSKAPSTAAPAAHHRNGVVGIDHVVMLSPDLDRTIATFAGLGVEPRRIREVPGDNPMRQVFYRLGGVILEVIGSPTAAGDGPASLWGITYVVADIDATAGYFGDRLGRVKDAVQPGRRIATLRQDAGGLSVPTAFISGRDAAGPRPA